ncbi:location of vulva defective 1-like isoform X2 [Temnothorax curvispinosus]|uniref:Location of vulva defective 1-like isoform X2 n=1 Tax=Temnothorax curvispinosus TaxID=300111 RepID=A0A6J1PS05_9HYME|nr:location of vulva defective 1-like isoform X2 [Temnothorax curvispinosus]
MHLSTRTQSGVVCPVAKMRPLSGVLLLLLLLNCQLVTPTPIFDRDGAGFRGRSTGFGETIRDWFKVLKDRIVRKWQEWFGEDSPTSSLSPQDILNIDKNIGGRIPGYPGLVLDLFAGNDYDSDSDEWDMRPWLPNLPSPPTFGIEWTPDFRKFGTSETTQSPTTTPKIESTTSRQRTTQTVTETQSALTSTGSTVTTTEATVTSTESISLTTQLITTSVEPNATSTEEILTSSESVVTDSELGTIPTESTVISIETITEKTVPSIESTVLTVEPISSTESTSVKSIETSIESSEITTEASEASVTSTEEVTVITTVNESPITSTELTLPIFNKRVEENETINKRTTKKPRPASAEVII